MHSRHQQLLWWSKALHNTFNKKDAVCKDVLPIQQRNIALYQYMCRCDCRYVSRTFQRLQDRIKQHVTKAIRTKHQQQRPSP